MTAGINSGVILRRKGGEDLKRSRPVVSCNNKLLFVNCADNLRVFSLKTGQCTQILSPFQAGDSIVDVLSLHGNPVALTSRGYVQEWMLNKGANTRKSNISISNGKPIAFFRLPPSTGASLCICKLTLNSNLLIELYTYPGLIKVNHRLIGKKLKFSSDVTKGISFGGFEEIPVFGILPNKTSLVIQSVDGRDYFTKTYSSTKCDTEVFFTSVRCCPSQSLVAAGTSVGEVIVFRPCLIGQGAETIYHWHATKCNDIAFTPAGASMFTGGMENVLVKWNIETPALRHYLPRLQAEILYIEVSNDNQTVVTTTADNCIHIASSSLQLQCTIQDLTLACLARKGNLFPAGLHHDPRTKAIALNGRPGHLQFYSPQMETVLMHVDVVHQNFLSQERGKRVDNMEVGKCCLSSDGLWLATVESNNKSGAPIESRLKFWQYLITKNCFSLITSIESPHNALVSKILFQPGKSALESMDLSLDHLLVTVGQDNKFKTWTPTKLDEKTFTWSCENVGFFRYKNCEAASFAEDGSLLAVGFEETLTIWDTREFKVSISLTFGREPIRMVEFGKKDCCHLVVLCTTTQLKVCSLLTTSLIWSVSIGPYLLISDPISTYMAVFTRNEKIFVFDPLSKTPLFTYSFANRPLGAVFVPRSKPLIGVPAWTESSQLYVIDALQELNCFENQVESDEAPSVKVVEVKQEAPEPIRTVRTNKSHTSSFLQFGVMGANTLNQLLKSPAHTMPSVSLLCSALMKEFVFSRKREETPKKS